MSSFIYILFQEEIKENSLIFTSKWRPLTIFQLQIYKSNLQYDMQIQQMHQSKIRSFCIVCKNNTQ